MCLAMLCALRVPNNTQTSPPSNRCGRTRLLMPATPSFNPPPTSLYIHLPFCVQKCAYCAFPVVVSSSPSAHKSYIDILTREIAAYFAKRDSPPPLHTLYLGGGTPSLLHPSLLEQLLNSLRKHVPFHQNIEFTAEMDPATFDLAKAQRFASLGVNRASIGAQSFDDNLLSMCRRIHNSNHIHNALHTVRHAGIPKVSLDLISGLPTQTRASWRHSLHQALSLQPDHISTYDLTLEPGTPFHARYTEGITPLPDENHASAMMSDASQILSDAGFEHYEISNFAKRSSQNVSTNRSQHNMAYWNNRPFYAFGLGATSLVDGFRFARPRTLRNYTRYVQNLEAAVRESRSDNPHHLHTAIYPHMSPQTDRERLEDFLINSFRMLVDGVNMSQLEAQFGTLVRQRLQSAIRTHAYLQDEGLVEVVLADGFVELIRLTEKGARIENSILSSLMQDAVWCFPEEDQAEA